MRQQIRGHERTVAVSEHADAIAIDDTHLHGFVDGGLRIHLKLLYISIVDRVGVTNDRHCGVIEQRVAVQHDQLVIGEFGNDWPEWPVTWPAVSASLNS